MRRKKINKIFLKEKASKKCFINQTKTPLTCQNLFLNEKKKFSHQKSTKPRSMLPFQEAMGETSHKQQNLIFTSFNSEKIINIHHVALK